MTYASRRLTALLCVSSIAGLALADNEEIPAEVFARLPALSQPALSPDGQYAAFMRPIDGVNNIMIQPLNGAGNRIVIPPDDAFVFKWIHWASNDRLVFAGTYFGEKFGDPWLMSQLASIDKNGGEISWLFQRKRHRQVVANKRSAIPEEQDDVIHWLPGDPEHILIAVDVDGNGDKEVRKLNIVNGATEIVAADIEGITNWLAGNDGTVRFGYGLRSGVFRSATRADDGNWSKTVVHERDARRHFPVAIAGNQSHAYFIENGESGFRIVTIRTLSTFELVDTLFSADGVDAEKLVIDEHSGRVIGVHYFDDFPSTYYFDEDDKALQRSLNTTFPGLNPKMASIAADRSMGLVRTGNDRDPGTIYLWDIKAGRMEIVTQVNPAIQAERMRPVRAVRFPALDGSRIAAFLTLPSDTVTGPLPAVIIVNDALQLRADRRFSGLVQYLASGGYAVMQTNVRGTSGYGVNYRNATRNPFERRVQDDVAAAAKWLVDEKISSPEKICVFGRLTGGHAAMMTAIRYPDSLGCVVSNMGIYDLPLLESDIKNFNLPKAPTFSLVKRLPRTDLARLSPYHRAEELKVPVLLMPYQAGHLKDPFHAERMQKRLRKLGKEVTLTEVQLASHSAIEANLNGEFLEAVAEFMNDTIEKDQHAN